MVTNIIYRTVVGDYLLDIKDKSLSLYQICNLYRIPYQNISVYLMFNSTLELFVGIHKTIDEITNEKDINEIIFYSDNNSNYQNIYNKTINIQLSNSVPTTEYSFQSDNDLRKIEHIEFSKKECIEFIQNDIKRFFQKYLHINSKEPKDIVIGVSGGGDSNALLIALANIAEEFFLKIHPVMVRGIPGTDLGYKRAKEICDGLNLTLIEVSESKVNLLIGRKINSNWISAFLKVFPESDIEIIATLAIRLSLFDIAKTINTDIAVLGVNLEDILAESFLRTMQGKLPLPFPIRTIGENQLWFPLYNTPKKIIDGCFPKYSIENYSQRIPNVVAGRDLSLFLAQNISNISNCMEFDFINGFQKLSLTNKRPFIFNKKINQYVVEDISSELINRWKEYLNI